MNTEETPDRHEAQVFTSHLTNEQVIRLHRAIFGCDGDPDPHQQAIFGEALELATRLNKKLNELTQEQRRQVFQRAQRGYLADGLLKPARA